MDFSVSPNPQTDRVEVTMSLTAAEVSAIGGYELTRVYEWFTTALAGLVAARTGHWRGDGPAVDAAGWAQVIRAIDYQLAPRLDAILRHAVREHQLAGGSLGDLADALDLPNEKSAPQNLRRKAADLDKPFTGWAAGREAAGAGAGLGGFAEYFETPEFAEGFNAVSSQLVIGPFDSTDVDRRPITRQPSGLWTYDDLSTVPRAKLRPEDRPSPDIYTEAAAAIVARFIAGGRDIGDPATVRDDLIDGHHPDDPR